MQKSTARTAFALALALPLLAPGNATASDTFETTELGNDVNIDLLADGRIPAVGGNFGHGTSSFRIFQPDGTPSAPLVPLNSSPPKSFNIRPAIATAGDGTIISVWDQNSAIFGQRFSSSGNAVGDPFQVNDRSDSDNSPSVAANASGQFIVAWTYNLSGTRRARLRHYDADGTPRDISTSFLSPINPSQIQLMLRDDRRANAVWGQTDNFADRSWIHGSHLREDGYTLRNFTIDRTESGDGSHVFQPSAQADATGRFLVAWRRRDPGLNDRVLAREYDENSQPIGPLYTLSDTTSNAGDPQVAVDANGRAIVAWTSDADSQLHYTTLLIGRSRPSPPQPVTNGVPSLHLTDLAINTSGHAAASWSAGAGISNITWFQNGTSATVDHGPSFDAWQTRNFLDPAGEEAAPDADPDLDRLPNLVEYKLGLPPNHHSPLPKPTHDGVYLNWTLSLNPAATNTTLEVQSSPSFSTGSWSSSVTLIESPGGTPATAVVRTPGGNAVFLRAQVTQTD